MLARAFFDDPPSVYLLPDPAKRARVQPWLYERTIRYGAMYGHVQTTDDRLPFPLEPALSLSKGKGPGVRSAAIWLPPGLSYTPIRRLLRSGLALAPLKFGFSSISRLMATNTVERLRAELAPEPHWYLWILGVEPAHQGQGLGSSLVETMLQRIDAERLPSYLETHKERNVTFYERHGYNVVHSGNIPNDGPAYWCLKREARR
jgi:GNAT superfamily N-acetyltransferase